MKIKKKSCFSRIFFIVVAPKAEQNCCFFQDFFIIVAVMYDHLSFIVTASCFNVTFMRLSY